MASNQGTYKEFERFLTMLLLIGAGIFLLYLIFAGCGLIVLKIIFSVALLTISVFSLLLLYKSKELLRSRSLWMTCGFCSLALLTIVSLLCNYPAP